MRYIQSNESFLQECLKQRVLCNFAHQSMYSHIEYVKRARKTITETNLINVKSSVTKQYLNNQWMYENNFNKPNKLTFFNQLNSRLK